METYFALNEDQVINYIKSNYGEFETGWFKLLSDVEGRELNNGFHVRRYAGKCACGECLQFSVYNLENEIIFSCKVCEECYELEDNIL